MADEENNADKKPNGIFGIRHLQAILLLFALVLAYGMRVNMSIAIVAMTDKDSEDSFDWSIQKQSVILSSFFWGYIVLQIPAGELAAKLGGSILVTVCIGINAVVSVLIPWSAYYGGWKLVCACRVLQGLTQGFIVPSIHNLIGKWAPVEEKSRLGALVHSGSQLGNAIQLVAAGFIASIWGWPAIFYANGAVGLLWTIIYIFLGSDSPQKSRMISEEERLYIQSSLGQVGKQKKLKTPWKAIWTSMPFISLIILHCGQNWGFWTLMTEMPSYMKQILGVDIKANGVMSALPYFAMYLLSFPFAFLADYMPNKGWLSVTAVRKLSNSIGFFGPAIALIGLSYTPAGNVMVAVILLTIVVGLNVGHITGLMLVHLDLAPNFAGTLLGITNCSANIISIIAPLVAGAVLKDESYDWSMQIQSVILSSFFWGYVILQVPGGELAARFGGSKLVTLSIALNAIVCMLIPLSVSYGGWKLMCACRVFQGLTQGFLVPSIHGLIGKWAPVEEKGRLGAMVHSGPYLGNSIQFVAAGYIANAWGWPAIFYANGAVGVLWTIIYIFLGSDSPQKSRMISQEERLYIQSSLGQVGQQKILKTPWKAIWTSMPFISLIFVHCGQNWGLWTLMTEMPSYMRQVLGVDIKSNGLMSALPYMAIYLLSYPFGFLADYIPNKKWLSVTATRKLSNSIGKIKYISERQVLWKL
ncbi:hypothetical protein O3G_MSEX005919 [Manduca sexta]|uniref:Putative inorganic phosphate cotransporter n=1 Tax=Manduca sexta TaxID=7130 RepID=A0A921Z2V5_MANSE|nr:hypothetical protein O3G_MSEX005919 [Manduca sexta]